MSCRMFLISVVLLLSVVLSPLWAQTVIYVDDDAPLGGDGRSWQNAYRFLQDGLRSDVAKIGDVEIRVAQGIYTPDRDNANPDGTGDRKVSFELQSGMTLKGGFAGLSGDDPNAWDVALYETVLSGDLAGNDAVVDDPCDLKNESSRFENSCNVIEIQRVSGIRLEGLIVSGGFGDITKPRDVASTTVGAGLRAIRCDDLSIEKCRFVGNMAVCSGGGAYWGRCVGTAILDCDFSENSCTDGGGILVYDSVLSLLNCDFYNNYATNGGVGISTRILFQ